MKLSHSPLLSQRLPIGRARFVVGLLLVMFGGLVVRSAYLQGIQNDFLQKEGEARYERVIDIPATRGRITDRHGDVLAVSTPVKSIWAIPEAARLTPSESRQLARLLELSVRDLNRKLSSERDFVFIKRQVPPDLSAKIAAMNLPGIHQQNDYRRFYPSGEMVAHMLGFTNVEDAGQEGIELAMNPLLAGKQGSRRVIRDRRGRIVDDAKLIRPPQEGKDITLSLDAKIQYLAHTHLKQAIADHHARAGGIVVLDAKTGEVLALANLPTYNPNDRSRLTGTQLRNRALTDTFEPGSTFKPFTVALALEKGNVLFNTPIMTGSGKMTIGTATISDAHPAPQLTVAQIIQKSSNIGAAKIALSMKPDDLWQMFDTLGFGTPLGLGFPGEAGGRLRPAKSWRPIEQATMAYGHGISVTLIQLAHAYLPFAREGDLTPLSLIKLDSPPARGKPVFSAQTAREMRAMLEMVVAPGGTAPKAAIPGYRVAGKTGTAHKLEGNAYVDKYVASFVGFAPVSDPRLIVAVMIDEPTGAVYYGGDVAAPVFARVMEGALRTLGISHDAPKSLLVAQGVAQ
ncbi:MAG: penicillin-binding protein 2 [Rhodocyclaceae bacterium]|nr:penicillin-binding protein 2 [Rhodocyclaceae bacterium]